MNDDEISQRLRGLPRPTPPAAWRREILAAAEVVSPDPTSWWSWLPAPSRAAWSALAAAWLLIFWLGAGPSAPAETGGPAPEELRALLLSRQRHLEDIAPVPPAAPPRPVERPTSAYPSGTTSKLS